jgi:predicted AlkP superfamily phosphohydrolase/phosphomutase
MNASPARRAMIIGIDGASMEIIKHMVERGHAPNLGKLIDTGCHREMLGVLPTLTPPGWTSMMTGCWPGSHEVTDFNIRALGRPLNETVWGINTALCKREYLWNAAERAGKFPMLIKFEMSWPPTIEHGIQIEGCGPGISNVAQIAGYHYFSNVPGGSEQASRDTQFVDPSTLPFEDRYDPVALTAAEGWRNLPGSGPRPLEVELVVRPLARGRPSMQRGQQGEPKRFFALLHGQHDAYTHARITRGRDFSDVVTDLEPGSWSDWLRDRFTIDGHEIEGHVRMKLLELAPDGSRFALFVPQIWPIDGYTRPNDVALELLQNVGPFLQNPARDALGLIDDDTYFEILEYHLQWLANASVYLAGTRPWDLLFVQTHAADYANHFFMELADPVCGKPAEVVERYYRGLCRTWQGIDRMVGKLLEAKDSETVVAVISDHGGTPGRYPRVNMARVLEQAGWLKYADSNKKRVDWSATRAHPVGVVNVFLNMKGREPEGTVDPADYERVRRELIALLMEYREPTTGEHPFSMVLTREDAEMVNLWGPLTGDVVYALRPEFDGAHGHQLPSARLGIGAQHATLILNGAGIRQGVHLEGQVRQVDVAPTLAYLLGLPVPRGAEGGVAYEALEEPDWHLRAIAELEAQLAKRALPASVA